jgi:uncharacterized RDD family membrane protein YckC
MEYFAKVRKRALGAVIDYAINYTATFAYVIAFGQTNNGVGRSLEGLEAFPIFLFWFLYFPVMEGITGQTLGKKIMKIRVVMLSTGDITIWRAFVRRIFDVVDLMFFGIVGILVIKGSDKRQRVGDLIAKTIVVEDKPARCENCKEEFTLSRQEVLSGRFICPNCNHENLSYHGNESAKV